MLDEPRFRKSNPDFTYGNPCVDVGMTGLSPDVRFDKRKAGIQANRFVTLYGVRLLPELYEVYNPMPYDAARDMEVVSPLRCVRRGMESGRLDGQPS